MDGIERRGAAQADLLKVPEVGARLGCSVRTVWRLLATKQLARVKVGRAVRVPASEVDRFIAEGGVR